MAFDERADVVALPGGQGDARAALSSVTPGYGGTRYASVIAKAADVAAGGPARLIVVTDLQRAGWEGEARLAAPASLTIDVRDAGAPPDNLAVAALRADPDRIVASIRNASSHSRKGIATLTHEGRVVARSPFAAPRESSVEIAFEWAPAAAGAVTVAVDDEPGFAADNTRHAVLGRSGAPAVMVLTSPGASGFYLLRALEAAGSGVTVKAITAAEIAGGRAAAISRQAAVVMLSTRNLDRPAREAIAGFVRGGGGLLIAAAADVEPEVVTSLFGWSASTMTPDDSARRVSLSPTDLRHPIFQPFGGLSANLGQVTFTRAWRVRPEGWQVPARFSDGSPAVLERSEGRGRVVLFASDLDRRWNDFPLHPAYVPFVAESVRHVSSRPAQPREFTVAQAPAGVAAAPGIHKTGDGRTVAVNVDPRESSTAVMTDAEFAAMVDAGAGEPGRDRQVKAEQAESRQNLWQYGVLLMLATLVAESFVGRVR
jgi:hypothetical protein